MARGENVFYRKDGRFEARYVKGRRADGKLIYGFCYGRNYEEARQKAELERRKLRESLLPKNPKLPKIPAFRW